jgi:hypothetical protein
LAVAADGSDHGVGERNLGCSAQHFGNQFEPARTLDFRKCFRKIDRHQGAARETLPTHLEQVKFPDIEMPVHHRAATFGGPKEYKTMAVTLNRRASNRAKELITEGKFVYDQRDAWSEHQPSAQQENEFIERHRFAEYAKWYLGINSEKPEDTKGRYEFPYGDFQRVHRCGVLTAESRAGQYKHFDIENAAAHLHGMIDAQKGVSRKRTRSTDHSKAASRRARTHV